MYVGYSYERKGSVTIGYSFQTALSMMTFILSDVCQREMSARAQADFMLFPSEHVGNPPEGLRDNFPMATQQEGSAHRRPENTGPFLCLQFLQK